MKGRFNMNLHKKIQIHQKKNNELKQWRKYLFFYFKQAVKAFIILLVVSMPLDIVNGMINNLAITLTDQTEVSYFADSAKLNYITTIASGIFLLGIYAIFFRMNWSYKKYEQKKADSK